MGIVAYVQSRSFKAIFLCKQKPGPVFSFGANRTRAVRYLLHLHWQDLKLSGAQTIASSLPFCWIETAPRGPSASSCMTVQIRSRLLTTTARTAASQGRSSSKHTLSKEMEKRFSMRSSLQAGSPP